MLKVCIVGASGYTGGELIRLLLGHPHVQITGLYGTAEKDLLALFPGLRKLTDLAIRPADELPGEAQAAFLAVPHGQAAPLAARLLDKGLKVIDLSGDLRLKDDAQHEKHYGRDEYAKLRHEAVYGLPELNRAEIKKARLVANPGCYPTASILALKPLAHLAHGPLIVDAKSGLSGAGRTASATTHYCQVNDNFRPYNLGVHRHQPEIEQGLGQSVFFSPHLAPMTRGILATCYARVDGPVEELYLKAYQTEPFVRLLSGDELPQTRATAGSNFCDIAVRYDAERKLAVVVSALDNLVKGAAGQAIQNLSLMHGLSETEGLLLPALYP
ncbi:N-acetyl-gamma-glutamyl-phosphate reductase [bacterium CPR1]|nr:N-acetyl-gamma-glutamyl-phosphate reductase [bacterium CPR1]